ncbi:type II toxin-antitoxin system YafQ family toxin [Cerasicoccus fimbriatus]|uniref:type II toxin-antitoxin system YafQ family toxin n=1 Tax=Cerasicoccus fimbriatus TaxID=3014554 RepID=UPI0022B3449F|nr:type II toxin-antitoxin system YafQ family toxin [Cerasicoccus sp. TK19100]
MEIYQTSRFKKDVKRQRKRGKDLSKLTDLISKIISGVPLDPRYREHPLTGNWLGSIDCHIEPDWLLIYRIDGESLFLERTGSHSDLFG